jgi:hypothetical protein
MDWLTLGELLLGVSEAEHNADILERLCDNGALVCSTDNHSDHSEDGVSTSREHTLKMAVLGLLQSVVAEAARMGYTVAGLAHRCGDVQARVDALCRNVDGVSLRVEKCRNVEM